MKKSVKKILFCLVLLLIPPLLFWQRHPGSTPQIKDKDGKIVPNSIAALVKIKLGGMDQWILMRGNGLSNPVLLWLHGGPGSAQMPITRHYNGSLEKDFITVHWDQRGAGKSNPQDFDESTMTFGQFISDAHELTQYLKSRFKTEKLYLVGHSWDTQLGSVLAYKYPEDYYAYVAVSQVVNNQNADAAAYAWLKDQIANNRKDADKLSKLGAPPYSAHDTYVKFAKMVDSYGGGMDAGFGKLARAALSAPEYRPGDYIAWFKGTSRGSGPMWLETQSFDLFKDVPQLHVPVYFFSGKNDYNTPVRLVEDYYKALDAPKGKQLVIFEKSAHTPFIGESDKFNQEILRVKAETFK